MRRCRNPLHRHMHPDRGSGWQVRTKGGNTWHRIASHRMARCLHGFGDSTTHKEQILQYFSLSRLPSFTGVCANACVVAGLLAPLSAAAVQAAPTDLQVVIDQWAKWPMAAIHRRLHFWQLGRQQRLVTVVRAQPGAQRHAFRPRKRVVRLPWTCIVRHPAGPSHQPVVHEVRPFRFQLPGPHPALFQ